MDQGRTHGCMGGLTRLLLQDRDTLIISNQDMEVSQRERISVWASFDNGKTWPVNNWLTLGETDIPRLLLVVISSHLQNAIYLLKQGPIKSCGSSRVFIAWVLGGEVNGDGVLANLM